VTWPAWKLQNMQLEVSENEDGELAPQVHEMAEVAGVEIDNVHENAASAPRGLAFRSI